MSADKNGLPLVQALAAQYLEILLPSIMKLIREKRIVLTEDEIRLAFGLTVPRMTIPLQMSDARRVRVRTLVPPQFTMQQLDQAFDFYDKYGYVRIQVLDEKTIATMTALFWQYMRDLNSGITEDPKTWTNYNWPGTFSVGIISQYGIGQSALQWAMRTNKNVQQVFRSYFSRKHETKEIKLRTSFDGVGVFRGAEHKVDFNKNWLHIDKNVYKLLRTNPSLTANDIDMQGAINLTDCLDPDSTGSFLCLPGGHHTVLQRVQSDKESWLAEISGNYCRFPEDHYFYQQELSSIVAAAGDGIFWNSALPHSGYAPTNSKITGKLRRLISYVSMAPTVNDEKLLKSRIIGASQGYTTSHEANVICKQQVSVRPRHKTLKALTTPTSSLKNTFTPDEAALL